MDEGHSVELYKGPFMSGDNLQIDAVATEGGRFTSQPMCTDLTGECARKYKAALEDPDRRMQDGKTPGNGPRNVLLDIALGRVESSVYTPEEAMQKYIELNGRNGKSLEQF